MTCTSLNFVRVMYEPIPAPEFWNVTEHFSSPEQCHLSGKRKNRKRIVEKISKMYNFLIKKLH